MELRCSCITADYFEKFPKMLVRKEIAEIAEEKIIKDDNDELRERSCKYKIFIGDWGEEYAIVRWWKNVPLDRASIQMTHEALDAILESATVMALLIRTGQQISKNGHGFNLQDISRSLMALAKTEQVDIKEGDIEVVP
jgi:hypothetical protein